MKKSYTVNQNPVTVQPADIVAPPGSDSIKNSDNRSQCWRSIFCCSGPPPPPAQEEMSTMEVHPENIAPPKKYPLVKSAFPANMAGDLDDGNDDMASEISEDTDTENFIRGYSNIKLEASHS
ncbi:hypothetical protein ACTXT7_012999 [Hymenolepis weldensis]